MTARSEVGIDLIARDMASQAIRQVGGSMRDMGVASQESARHVGLMGTIVDKVTQGVFLGIGLMAVQKFTQTIMSVPASIISMNSSLESSTLQFETLFKDADRAREHVAMLFEFAKKTPFETQPIIQASRTMQTFGGDALNTAENLTMIGDAAAGASTNINEVAFWVSRAYAAIQGGQPFGEARMRLQELALLSPQAAAEMERMQKAGASTSEVWKVLQAELGKFNGAMVKQAGTWTGLMSTLNDTFQLTISQAFKPFFEYAKQGLEGLITLLSDPAVQETIAGIGTAAVGVFEAVVNVIQTLWPVIEGALKLLGQWLGGAVKMWTDVAAAINRHKGAFTAIAVVIGVVLTPALLGLAAAGWAAIAPWAPLIAAIILITQTPILGWLFDIVGWFVELVAQLAPVQFFMKALGQIVDFLSTALGQLVEIGKDVLQFFGLIPSDAEEAAAAAEAAAQRMTTAMAPLKAEVDSTAEAIGTLPAKITQDLVDGAPAVAAAATVVARGIDGPLKLAQERAKDIAFATPLEVAKAIQAGRDPVKIAAGLLKDAIESRMSEAQEIAALTGTLMGEELARNLKDEDAGVRSAANALKAAAEERLFALQHNVDDIAADTGRIYPDVLQSTRDEVTRATNLHLSGMKAAMKAGVDEAKTYGTNTGEAFGEGVAAGIRREMYTVKTALAGMQKLLEASSPPGPESPLHKIDVWGARTAAAWTNALVGGLDAAAAAVRGAIAPIALSLTPASPVALGAVSGGGVQQIIHQEFHFGPDSVRSDDDIRRIGVAMQERAQLQGFAATAREIGRAVG